MEKVYVSVGSLKTYLNTDGYVALTSDEIDPALELDIFGPEGVSPPSSLASLLSDMLQTMKAAPDKSDAADLRSMAVGLKSSLELVETTLARLDDKHG